MLSCPSSKIICVEMGVDLLLKVVVFLSVTFDKKNTADSVGIPTEICLQWRLNEKMSLLAEAK